MSQETKETDKTNKKTTGFGTIEQALEELQRGHIIMVTDDEDRENEGDFICAAQFADCDNVNFMAAYGKGLICMPMSGEYCDRLMLPQMVSENKDNHETAFTVSIDYTGTTTGISAEERSMTAMHCVREEARPEDFRRPGHMFPLRAKKNGVLERPGHTEATVDLMRLAGLKECGLCCEIMREDGTMMRTSELLELAKAKAVDIYPQRGSTVSLIDYDLVEEACFVRSVLETAVVEVVCGKATEASLEELEGNVKLQWFYLKERVTEKLLELDDEFHRLMFKTAGKMQAYQMMKGMMIHFDRVRNMALGTIKDRSLVEDHEKILEAVRDRDPMAARTLMERHLKRYQVDEEEIRRRYPGYFKSAAK